MTAISALQFAVPAAHEVLARMRPLLTKRCTVLDPPHISFGYPWLPAAAARDAIASVEAALSEVPPVPLRLVGPRRFATDHRGRVVLYLAPDPPDDVLAVGDVISTIAGLPRAFTPHCSLVRLAADVDPAPFEAVAAASLPLQTVLHTIELHVRDRSQWGHQHTIELTGQ